MPSPTERTLKELRKDGYLCAVVEKWNPHALRRQDLFGFIDILAVRPGEVLGVQCTVGSSAAERVTKIKAHPNLAAVLAAGIRVEVWGWRKLKAGISARKTVIDGVAIPDADKWSPEEEKKLLSRGQKPITFNKVPRPWDNINVRKP